MYKSVCIFVLLAVSAYGDNEPKVDPAAIQKCKDLSGVTDTSVLYNGKYYGELKNSTCFMACLDRELKTAGWEEWNADGSLNLDEMVKRILDGKRYIQADNPIQVVTKCSETKADNYCDRVFDTINCIGIST